MAATVGLVQDFKTCHGPYYFVLLLEVGRFRPSTWWLFLLLLLYLLLCWLWLLWMFVVVVLAVFFCVVVADVVMFAILV